MSKKKIINWVIVVKWDNGKEEEIGDMPDDISQPVDDYLTEIENEQNKR